MQSAGLSSFLFALSRTKSLPINHWRKNHKSLLFPKKGLRKKQQQEKEEERRRRGGRQNGDEEEEEEGEEEEEEDAAAAPGHARRRGDHEGHRESCPLHPRNAATPAAGGDLEAGGGGGAGRPLGVTPSSASASKAGPGEDGAPTYLKKKPSTRYARLRKSRNKISESPFRTIPVVFILHLSANIFFAFLILFSDLRLPGPALARGSLRE